MTLLLFGAQGQVGQELQNRLPQDSLKAIARPQLDLTQRDALRDLIQHIQPTIVINAAAYTAVDRAESEPDLAQRLNTVAPQVMAEECDRLGATLIHLSTDYVFDGRNHRPYREDDPPNPLSVYGQTKLAGEQAIQAAIAQHYILRTAWVYGSYGKSNFVKTMLRLGSERDTLRIVADQIGTPTWAADIATTIVHLIRHLPQASAAAPNPSPPAPFGVYHCTNSGVASWYDFAIAIFEEAHPLGWPHSLPALYPIASHEYPTPAQRPHYSLLDGSKLAPWLSTPLPHWRRSLRLMLRDYFQDRD